MMLSTIDLTQRLDQLEDRLPPLSAKSVALGRATVRRTNDMAVSVISDVARRVDTVITTARSGAKQTAGQATSSVNRTAKMAETTTKQTVGQAKSAATRTAKMAETGAKQTAGQARSSVNRTAKMAETTTKQTVGQAKTAASRTADAAQDAAGDLLDDAAATVDPDAAPRGIAYEEWTKSELYDRAQAMDIEGRSVMSKSQLIKALRSS